jgi:hypothetical protein
VGLKRGAAREPKRNGCAGQRPPVSSFGTGSAQTPRMNPCPSARPGEGEQEENRRGDRPVCSDRRERRSGDTDFLLAGGVRAEPSHSQTKEERCRASDTMIAATIVTRKGGDAGTAAPVAARLERDRAQRVAAKISSLLRSKTQPAAELTIWSRSAIAAWLPRETTQAKSERNGDFRDGSPEICFW